MLTREMWFNPTDVVEILVFGVWVSGFRVQVSGFWFEGFWVQVEGFRFLELGFWVGAKTSCEKYPFAIHT